MKGLKETIGIIELRKPILLDFDALKKIFPEAEIVDNTIKVSAGFTDHSFMSDPLLSDAKLLFAHETHDGFRVFASILTLAQLEKLIQEIPDTNKIYDALNLLLLQVKNSIQEREQTTQLNNELFKLYVKELKENGVESLHAKQIQFSGYATNEQLQQTSSVPEHAYVIESFADFHNTYVGTAYLGTCLFVVAVNTDKNLIAATHLDYGTIENYRSSLEDLFNKLKSNNKKTDVYILGGKNLDLVMLHSDARISKTLILSLEKFIKSRNDLELAGTFIFPNDNENVSAFVAGVNRINGIQFYRVANELDDILVQNSTALIEKHKIIGLPIMYTQLVALSDCTTMKYHIEFSPALSPSGEKNEVQKVPSDKSEQETTITRYKK